MTKIPKQYKNVGYFFAKSRWNISGIDTKRRTKLTSTTPIEKRLSLVRTLLLYHFIPKIISIMTMIVMYE